MIASNGNDYDFINQFSVHYQAYFTDASGYFEDHPFAQHAAMFGIRVVSGPDRPRLDARTGLTVVEIIAARLAEAENVVIYVCDPKDHRQEKRHAHFKRWFSGSGAAEHGIIFQDISKDAFFAALIYRADNPDRTNIETEIERLLAKDI